METFRTSIATPVQEIFQLFDSRIGINLFISISVVDENEYIEIHDTYCDEWSLDTYEENDFEVDCEEVEHDKVS